MLFLLNEIILYCITWIEIKNKLKTFSTLSEGTGSFVRAAGSHEWILDSPTVWEGRLCGWPRSWSAEECIWVRAGWGAYWKAACCSSTSWLQKWGRVAVRLPRSTPFWCFFSKETPLRGRKRACHVQITWEKNFFFLYRVFVDVVRLSKKKYTERDNQR